MPPRTASSCAPRERETYLEISVESRFVRLFDKKASFSTRLALAVITFIAGVLFVGSLFNPTLAFAKANIAFRMRGYNGAPLAPNRFAYAPTLQSSGPLNPDAAALLNDIATSSPPSFASLHPPDTRTAALLALPPFATTTSPAHPDVVAAHQAQKSRGPSGKLLIIVPFRENDFGATKERAVETLAAPVRVRTQHVVKLLFELDKHLRAVGKLPNRDYAYLIAEQANYDVAFNKGAVINVGMHIARLWGYDYAVLHDADMYPRSLENTYDLPEDGLPVHMCTSPRAKNAYMSYGNNCAGVFACSVKHFFEANGMSNLFWGWGYEDDMIRATLGRNIGFRRLNASAGYYENPYHKNEVSRMCGSLSQNNKHRFHAYWTGRTPVLHEDGVNQLNATVTRYAPLKVMPGVHWVTATLDTLVYRPSKTGYEAPEITQKRLNGELPPLMNVGIKDNNAYVVYPPYDAGEELFIKEFRERSLKSYQDRNVTYFPKNMAYLG